MEKVNNTLYNARKYILGIFIASCCVIMSIIFAIDFSSEPTIYARADGTIIAVEDIDCNIGSDVYGKDGIFRLLDRQKSLYGFDSAIKEFRISKTIANANGYVYKLEQIYNNIPVYARGLSVQVSKNNVAQFITGNYLPIHNIQTSACVSLSEARQILRQKTTSTEYSSELCIFSIDNVPILCYDFVCDYNQGSHVFINANSGEVVSIIPLSSNIITQDSANLPDLMGNNVTIPLQKDADTYYLADPVRNIYMFDANFKDDYMGVAITSATKNFSAAEVTTYNNLIKSLDFYKNENSVGVVLNGIDGTLDDIVGNASANNEIQIKAIINYKNNYENAAYIGDKSSRVAPFIFGNSSSVASSTMGRALDVVGHEYHHAITEYNAPLIYLNESGAINEAISDIFGALIEGNALTDTNFWLCGDAYASPVRNMKDPVSLGAPIKVTDNTRVPNCNLNHNHEKCDNGGVHINSNIISHLVYTMYELDKAFFTKEQIGKLWYTTQTNLPTTSTFLDLKVVMTSVAKGLGYTDTQLGYIKSAFDAADIKGEGLHTITFRYPDGQEQKITKNYNETFVCPALPTNNSSYFEYYGWCDANVTDSNNKLIYKAGETYKMLTEDVILTPCEISSMWNGLQPVAYERGNGTNINPYIIKTAAQLATLAYKCNNSTTLGFKNDDTLCYKLDSDIDLQNIPWIPIGISELNSFYGYFNGDGHKITNLKLVSNTSNEYFSYTGLFGVVCNSVSDLTVEGSPLELTTLRVGIIAGLSKGNISRCSVNVDITATELLQNEVCAGGIVGVVWATSENKITDCINNGNITIQGEKKRDNAGGIIGEIIVSEGKYDQTQTNFMPAPIIINNCINNGNISATNAGGICADAISSYFINCINSGDIVVTKSEGVGGGIVANLSQRNKSVMDKTFTARENSGLFSCISSGNVSAKTELITAEVIGGIVGKALTETTLGQVICEKNIYKTQGDITAIGNYSALSEAKQKLIVGEQAKSSVDAIYSGDFDFGNSQYYSDISRWTILNGVGTFNKEEWTFAPNAMPTFKTYDYWFNQIKEDTKFNGGNGTKDNPYKISTPQQLALIATLTLEKSEDVRSYYIQTADIDLSGYIWASIGYENVNIMPIGFSSNEYAFDGDYNGGGHKISNMTARDCGFYFFGLNPYFAFTRASLFGSVSGDAEHPSKVYNVELENADCRSFSVPTAGITAVASSAIISNCSVSGQISSLSSAGGIVGEAVCKNSSVNITECENSAVVSGFSAGGIVGSSYNDKMPKDSLNSLNVYNNVNNGNVSSLSLNDSSYYEDSQNNSLFNKWSAVGGICGSVSTYANFEYNINNQQVSGYGDYCLAGGILGSCGNEKSGLSASNEQECEVNLKGNKQASSVNTLNADNSDRVSVMGGGQTIGSLVGGAIRKKSNQKFTLTSTNNIYVGTQNILGFDALPFIKVQSNGDASVTTPIGEGALDFDNIDFFFMPEYWGEITAEQANNMYFMLNKSYVEHEVKFLDLSGELISTQKVKHKMSAVAPTIEPPPSDAQYEYVFDGFDKPINNITENVTITPKFLQTKRVFTVIFLDRKNQILSSQLVSYGESATAPTVADDEDNANIYKFDGWNKTYDSITEDITIAPNYILTPKPPAPIIDSPTKTLPILNIAIIVSIITIVLITFIFLILHKLKYNK